MVYSLRMAKDNPIPYLVRLGKKDRHVLDTYVRTQKRAGERDCHASDGIRAGIQLLAEQMRNEKTA